MERKKTVKDLRKAYENAVKEGLKQFEIEDYGFLTNYAKYLLQYIDIEHIPDSRKLEGLLVKT